MTHIDNNIFLGFYDHGNHGHDFSMSMILDKKIYAIEMERLDKLKHSSLSKYKNKSLDDYLEPGYNYLLSNVSCVNNTLYTINHIPQKIENKTISNVNSYTIGEHHYLHACSAFYGSNFGNSAILTVDGSGANTATNQRESQAIWYSEGNTINQLYYLPTKTLIGSGIGRAYSDMSDLIGLEEGSIMGLSAYGNYDRFSDIIFFEYDGLDVVFNREYLKILNSISGPEGIIFFKELFGITSEDYSHKEKDITKSIFADIAAKIQKETEEAMVYLANKAYELTKSDNLCLAGGVALNILANTKILEKTKFKKVFVCPAANDGGISLGAAYHGYHVIGGNTKRIPIVSAGLGNTYLDSDIENSLIKYKDYLEYKKISDFREVAQLLNKGNIIGWFQGGSEFGPRSLGFRSILASPKSLEIKDRVNKIKSREWWRPVAPSILEEYLQDYFETKYPSPFMTFSSKVKENKVECIPAVVHIDGTARYHTVNKIGNEKYTELLSEFYKIAGIPVLINTSFNVKGQPIVENPEDAIKTFLSTELDYLIIGNYIVSKNRVYKEFAFNVPLYRLRANYKNEKSQDLYIKKYNILIKILFNNTVEEDFIYDEDGFLFILIDNEKKYNIFVGKYMEEKGSYKKIKDLCIRLETINIFNETNIDGRIKKILDTSALIIEQNYDKLIKIITV